MRKLVVAPLHLFFSNVRNPLPDEINLDGGYVLKKFDTSLLNPVFEFFEKWYSEDEKEELRRCTYAVYYEYETEDETSTIPEEVIANISRIIMALRVVKRTKAVATIIHLRNTGQPLTAIDALQVIPKQTPVFYMGLDEHMEHFESTDAELIKRYFRSIKGLYEAHGGTYHKVLNSLIFFELAQHEQQYQIRLILLVTCLESLFNTSSEQVGYTLKIRCSYFIERDPNRRVQLAKLIKRIYDLRSKFVHGQGTPDRVLRDGAAQKEFMMEIENIGRRCINPHFAGDLDGMVNFC